MPHNHLADTILLLHVGFVLFVVAGGFLAWRWPWLRWVHLPAAVWGVVLEAAGLTCPLTPLEHWLRQTGDSTAASDLLGRLLLPILYPEELTRAVQIALACFVAAINGIAYSRLWHSRSP